MLSACCLLHGRVGSPSCPPAQLIAHFAPQALEELKLSMALTPLRELLPELRAFPRLKELTLRGHYEEGFALSAAVLRHLLALEKLVVLYFGSVSLSEPLTRLTCLVAYSGYRLEVGAGAALPCLRSLDTEAIGTMVLPGILPQLTRLRIQGDERTAAPALVSVPMLGGYCFVSTRLPWRSAVAREAAMVE